MTSSIKKRITTALFLADRLGEELSPLNSHYPPALIPLAGKSPIEYWIEQVCARGFSEVIVIATEQTLVQIRQQMRTGAQWDLKLSYLTSSGEEHPEQLIQRYRSELPKRFLLARADQLPDPNAFSALGQGSIIDLNIPVERSDLDAFDWPQLIEAINSGQIDPEPGWLTRFDDLLDTSLALLSDNRSTLIPRGMSVGSGQWIAKGGFSTVRCSQIPGRLYVGRNALVDKGAQLKGELVIGANSLIDRGAELSEAMVLPGTYVGRNVRLERCILSGNLLIDLERSVQITLDDPALVAEVYPPGSPKALGLEPDSLSSDSGLKQLLKRAFNAA